MMLTAATIAEKAGKAAISKQTTAYVYVDVDVSNNNKTKQRTETRRRNFNIHRKIRSTIWQCSDWNVGNRLLLFCLLMALRKQNGATASTSAKITSMTNGEERMTTSSVPTLLSQLPLTAMVSVDEGSFRPIIPKDLSPEFIAQNVFTKSGHYRVFQNDESDLRMVIPAKRKESADDFNSLQEKTEGSERFTRDATPTTIAIMDMTVPSTEAILSKSTKIATSGNDADDALLNEVQRPTEMLSEGELKAKKLQRTQEANEHKKQDNNENNISLNNELKELEDLLIDYVKNFFNKGVYEPMPGLVVALQQNHTSNSTHYSNGERSKTTNENRLRRHVRQTLEEANVNMNLPRAVQSGRFLFFSGLKKIMWPIYMGLQVLKSLLFALFLPTIIGSVSKLIGKGISSGSASSVPLFVRPMEAPQDLDFRDANFNFDDDKFTLNADDEKDNYNQAASQTQPQYTPYNAAAINQQALDRQHQQLMQDTYLSALQSIGAASFKNSQGISSGSLGGGSIGPGISKKPAALANMNTFQTFQKVPATSLLLSNYDPFYSPLLSRLDSVFAQLKLNSENEICREKLICLMYANPAKYAPYSNLVSAQLSRELNELRKPTSDNPDILRFFKYMRAAKDGQDGIDCEESFAKCQEFKDFESPAMLSTYNDINKLVQARKLS